MVCLRSLSGRLFSMAAGKKRSGLDEFFPVRFSHDGFAVEPLPYGGSGDIIAALHADALAWHPAAATELSDGPVKILLL